MAMLIDYTDVTVERIRTECQYWCEKGRVTHAVKFEIRANGETVTLATGCSECMQKYSDNIKSGLPAPRGMTDRTDAERREG